MQSPPRGEFWVILFANKISEELHNVVTHNNEKWNMSLTNFAVFITKVMHLADPTDKSHDRYFLVGVF